MAGLRRLATLAFCAALAMAPLNALAQEAQIAQANPFPQPIGKPPAQPQQPRPQQAASGDAVGSVASVTQPASVARAGTTSAALKKGDPIKKGDRLTTGAGGALGVTFDDETTFSLSANASLTIDEFVYSPGQRGSATINVARGTAGFVAAQVAKTGDMKITTPGAILGIRGTTGVIEVPPNAPTKVKLYQDENGTVGRIEIFRTRWRPGRRTDARRDRLCYPTGRATACRDGAYNLCGAIVARPQPGATSILVPEYRTAIEHPTAQSAGPGAGNPRNLIRARSRSAQSAEAAGPVHPRPTGMPGIPGLGR